MYFVLSLIALTSFSAFSAEYERCSYSQNMTTTKISKDMCHKHVNEFAVRSNASCKVVRYDSNVCWSECLDEEQKKLARVRIDMNSDCEREQVYYGRTIIKYYR